ncbi:MAG: DUF664 domain-containing protein [Caldilinea sp. CFX5]|nr:DUF664 domain-containing protein [Caldilinea sp. CFX5]
MNKRAQALAARLEQGAIELATYAEGLTPQQWATPVKGEGRSVGVLLHHVANMYPLEMQLAQTIAGGQAIAGVTWDAVADINAKHAHEHAEPDRRETLQMLRQNSAAAAAATRALIDEQLDIAVPNSLYGDAPMTLQLWLEDHPISHSYKHLAAIKAATV